MTDLIYGKNFATALRYQPKDKKEPENPVNMQTCENHISENVVITRKEY